MLVGTLPDLFVRAGRAKVSVYASMTALTVGVLTALSYEGYASVVSAPDMSQLPGMDGQVPMAVVYLIILSLAWFVTSTAAAFRGKTERSGKGQFILEVRKLIDDALREHEKREEEHIRRAVELHDRRDRDTAAALVEKGRR